MYDMMKGLAGASRLGGDGATGFNMQRSARGRAEAFVIEPLTLAAAPRRSGVRLAAANRGCDTRSACPRRGARVW